jgi:hypothetical protein
VPIHFGTAPLGPFIMPLVTRATLMEKAEPVVAETKLDIVPRP